ncbi:FUN14 domain-containing protein 1-like [Limulus polyphemus]|uniref:FUN14 domain-containing protein 1-like n=1 Tax=Limulus polyphemus TaxID=6850 RepID=A0ABM1C0S3_LIMPO|nr:FUN14 domain-containing protein 1-like [Limulus polyphemus]XP_013792248.1 FUN14 domain-containing protein 1-like [Limulus polyphemus]XP_022236822.1 FUN14 domain-containing protein 1-like [Limulus polyphemus]
MKPEKIIDVLDNQGRATGEKDWFQGIFGDVTKASAAKQTIVGGITGWGTGFVFTKVGKVAATAVGGSLLLIQIAQHQGYIRINWNRLNKDVETATKHVEMQVDEGFPRLLKQGKKFVKENIFLATGFAGGFLLGIASS